MSEPQFLMLTPAYLDSGVPGAVEITANCGHRAWISPLGLVFTLDRPLVRTQCQDCVNPEDITELQAMPGGAEDLASLIGQQEAERTIAEATADPAAMVRTLQAQSRRKRQRRTPPPW